MATLNSRPSSPFSPTSYSFHAIPEAVPPTKHDLTSPLYERQDNEGDEAWAAFRTYRDMGTARSLDAARQKLGNPSDGYTRVLEDWSSGWSWGRRCLDYDRHLDTIRRAAQEIEVAEMGKRQAQDAMDIQAALRPILKVMLATVGETEASFQSLPAAARAMLLKEVMPAFEKAAKLERLARGAETENVAHTGGSPVVEDLRVAYQERLNRRRALAGVGHGAPGGDAAAEPVLVAEQTHGPGESSPVGADVPAEQGSTAAA